MAIHAGASLHTEFQKKNQVAYEAGLTVALNAGYAILENNGSAIDAVEAAVRSMEDNYLFNCGRGSALNCNGSVEMAVSMMDGKSLAAGAGCSLTHIKNPISFAKKILEANKVVFLGGNAAVEMAKDMKLEIEPVSYFIATHQVDAYLDKRKEFIGQQGFNPHIHGTVGAVARDSKGNLAAGTSTGGTQFCQAGRIGDTAMIGVGTYANNAVCAVSCTGDGDILIPRVLAHSIYTAKLYKQLSMQEACDYWVHQKEKESDPDTGAISIDNEGNIGIAFNTEKMHRAWKSSTIPLQVHVLR